jgi:hypothetical protein
MTSMPEAGSIPGGQQVPVVGPLSGIWELGSSASVPEADLAIVIAWAFHRGLIPPPQRKSLPIQVST